MTALADVGGTCPPELAPVQRQPRDPPPVAVRRAPGHRRARSRRSPTGWAGAGSRSGPAEARGRSPKRPSSRSRTPRTLYSTIGFTWYRLWARPFVPNIEAIPPAERAYYEDFMCTTPHNPNNVDLSRDVLFQLTDAGEEPPGRRADGRPRLAAARSRHRICSRRRQPTPPTARAGERHRGPAACACARCAAGSMTHRNVAAWVAGVYGWMGATDRRREGALARPVLDDMIAKEIANSRDLHGRWSTRAWSSWPPRTSANRR